MEAPQRYDGTGPAVFLAGGITGCPDWPDEIQPIALFELGAFAASEKPIVVGSDPDYPRRTDLRLQLGHTRPGLAVHSSLESTIEAVVSALGS